jgi:putative selenate reductase molybdopterin-binding subunit
MGVNQSVPKIDGKGLVMGKAAYTDDLAPENSLIVKVLRSPHAYAEIMSIDTSEAEKTEGIRCVFTYKNVPDKIFSRAGQGYPEPSPYDKKILDRFVRYVGDAVAFLAGVDEESVDEAITKIKVTYRIMTPIIDFEKAKDSKTIVHDEDHTRSMFEMGHEPSRNIAARYAMEIGNVKEALKSCDIVHEGRYYTQAQAHCTMETHTAASWLDLQGRLVVMTSTQTPFHVRRILAKNLGMPISNIRVIKPRIGGGYGGKQCIHGEFFVTWVTLHTGLPAKIIYSRKETFQSTYTRHQMRIDMTIGAMKDGTIKAINMEVLSNTGAYGEHALTVLMVVGSKTLPLYNKVEAVAFSGDVVYTNTTPAGAYRGYGAIQGNFALESAIDELAEKLDIDPVVLRKKNMIHLGETSKIFEVMGEGQEGTPMTIESCELEKCLDICLEKLEYFEKGKSREISPHVVRGIGIAIAMQGSGIPHIDMGSSILKLNDDGSFNLMIGATDLGTGSDTIMAQIASETLKVPMDKIIVYSSDTDLTPFDVGAYASSTTFISGHSTRIAAENMIKEIKEAAKLQLGSNQVEYDGMIITSDKGDISLSELAEKLYYSEHQKQLVSSGSYVSSTTAPPYMAGGAEVEIDKRTGQIKLIRYVAAVDCGTTINPNLAKIQVEGALLQGIGMAMYEDVNYSDSGQLINNSFLKYNIPTRMEVGSIEVSFVESYEPQGPFGAKSVGEIGIDTPPAAIANAINNALGVRITRLPIKSENVWMKLNHN